ncbi:mRNA splicing factor [Hesseltinella vesiculosa]|uniref:mRNA splicing factor n=1 Tax=Hesseltinella vesiculosa TaxID=101127 RepID=A0A1X2GN64_9FUNG|nr:mRNA splicing factor [Hesseltinella vesiculosa]
MEAAAKDRKDRLAALRKRKNPNSDSRSAPSEDDGSNGLVFRSYTPQDESLKDHVQPASYTDIKHTAESATKHIPTETLRDAAAKETDEVDLFNLAPKKANWDLRRDVEKKMQKLDRRTQRAILDIIRQRLAQGGNLADAVTQVEQSEQRLRDQDQDEE